MKRCHEREMPMTLRIPCTNAVHLCFDLQTWASCSARLHAWIEPLLTGVSDTAVIVPSNQTIVSRSWCQDILSLIARRSQKQRCSSKANSVTAL
jgi:hypothetical protein